MLGGKSVNTETETEPIGNLPIGSVSVRNLEKSVRYRLIGIFGLSVFQFLSDLSEYFLKFYGHFDIQTIKIVDNCSLLILPITCVKF